jgi:hypothetical protein
MIRHRLPIRSTTDATGAHGKAKATLEARTGTRRRPRIQSVEDS